MGLCTGPFSRAIEQFVGLADSGAFESEEGHCIDTENKAIDMVLQALDEEQPFAPELLRAHFEGGVWNLNRPTAKYRWLKTSRFGARMGSVDYDEIGQMMADERTRLQNTLPPGQFECMKW